MYRQSFQLQSRYSLHCLSPTSNAHTWRLGTSPLRHRGYPTRVEFRSPIPIGYRKIVTRSYSTSQSEGSVSFKSLSPKDVEITADSGRSSHTEETLSTQDVKNRIVLRDSDPNDAKTLEASHNEYSEVTTQESSTTTRTNGQSTKSLHDRDSSLPQSSVTEIHRNNVLGVVDNSETEALEKAARRTARRARRRARIRKAKKASKLAPEPAGSQAEKLSKDTDPNTIEACVNTDAALISEGLDEKGPNLDQSSSIVAVSDRDAISNGSGSSESIVGKKKARREKTTLSNIPAMNVASRSELDSASANSKGDSEISSSTTSIPKSPSKQVEGSHPPAVLTSQPSQQTTPVQTVHDDLMQKLKSITREQSRMMAKQALIDLLRNKRDTLTRAGRQLIMRKLRSYLVTRNGASIEDVIEEATGRNSLLDTVSPTKPNYIAPVGTSIKEAMKAGNKTKSLSKESIESLKEMPHMKDYEIKSISADDLVLIPHDTPQPPVPLLAYGLDRALFNPGVYHLRDPRSRVFNFDPYLQTIMPVAEFDFDALKAYITSSRDKALIGAAQHLKKKYTGSTSSMTSALAHFHFLLSQWRDVNISNLSKGFPDSLVSFTAMQRCPTAIFLRWRNGTYAIDADKQYDTPNILAMLGKSMEKLLTLPTEDFERYRKPYSSQISAEERDEAESFHYTTHGDFLLRSQLDAYDSRLPGTGMFDLKTRAVVSIRVDAKNYEQGQGYEITGRHGEFKSFEREYYDMIRSAFLKYSLQVRMGRMDGIFVAFHNTERIFGFQYISISEMDTAIHGTEDTSIGDSEFKLSLELLNRVLDRATKRFPEQSLQLHFETRESKNSTFLYIFAKPISEMDIQKLQDTGKEEVVKFEKKVLGLHKASDMDEDFDENAEEAKAQWDVLQAEVEEEIEDEELQIKGTLEPGANGTDSILTHDGDVRIHDRSEHGSAQEVDDIISILDNDGMIAERTDSTHEHPDDVRTDCFQGVSGDQLKAQDSPADGYLGLGIVKGSVNTQEAPPALKVAPSKQESEPDTLAKQLQPRDNSIGAGKDVTKRRAAGTDSTISTTMDGQSEHNDKQEESNNMGKEDEDEKKGKEEDNLLAMYLTIRNKVNGEYVIRPENLTKDDTWSVEYALSRIPTHPRGETLYNSTLKRRKATMMTDRKNTGGYRDQYVEKLRAMAREGREFRRRQDELDMNEPMKVLRLNPSSGK